MATAHATTDQHQQQTELQNPIQAAIAKVTKQQQFVDAVISACADNYLPSSELFHKPEVRKMVKDPNHLSIQLSAAYQRGDLGRVPHAEGTTRYAYGKPNTPQAMMAQTAQARKVVGINERKQVTAHRPVQITLQFQDSEEALHFLMKNGLVSSMVLAM